MWVFQVPAVRIPPVQLDIQSSSPPPRFTRAALTSHHHREVCDVDVLNMSTRTGSRVIHHDRLSVGRPYMSCESDSMTRRQSKYLDNNHKLGFNTLNGDSAIYHTSLKFLRDEYVRFFLFVYPSVTLHFIFLHAVCRSLSLSYITAIEQKPVLISSSNWILASHALDIQPFHF